ncbi:xylose import ATP-binding protein XylG [Spirochaetia bacterium]|nr:xylose import ATP-binding protein XylG [Spirochaetia bacterium]
MDEYILKMENIVKSFPGVLALDHVDIALRKGTILGLVGENGAGKSTLIKVLSGVYPHGTFQGQVSVHGEQRAFRNERDSVNAGIAVIYQELMLFPELTIAENISLPTIERIVSKDRMHSNAVKWMKEVGLNENPETLLKNLGIGKQQLIEIAKVLSLRAKILILDEPSASLTDKDTEHLLGLLKELRNKGVSCIYISHKLNEVLSICDDVTVIRDGKTIDTKPAKELDEQKIIKMMVGRDMSIRFPPKQPVKYNDVVLEVKDITITRFDDNSKIMLDHINFSLKRGETLGIAGLMGAGRTELFNSIFGDFKGNFTGEIFVEGKKVKIRKPQDAINSGFGLITEDRKRNALNLIGSVKDNVIMVNLDKYTAMGVVNENLAILNADEMSKKTRIKTPSLETKVMNLSGGNQQKVVIAKWLLVKPKILIFDEPTRGIDVGAKYEIYTLMNELKNEGIGIIMISSELPEILGMSDRILVLNEGRITAEFDNEKASEEAIMAKLI